MELFAASTAFTIAILILGLLLGSAIVFLFTRVPYIPTPMRVVRKMVDLAALRGSERIYDLGCGDGRLLIEAKRRHPGIVAIGYEISPIPYLIAHICKTLRAKEIYIRFKSFFGENISDADIIFLYQMPHTMEKLEKKLHRELRPGTRVISHGFQFPGKEPVHTLHIGKKPTIFGFAHPQRSPIVYLYEW